MPDHPDHPEHRRARPARRAAPTRPWLPLGLLAVGLLVVAALLVDARNLRLRRLRTLATLGASPQEILLGPGGRPVADPKGFFTIVAPAGWKVVSFPESAPYNVVLYGPGGVDISIMATPVEYDGVQPLLEQMRKSENQYGLDTHIGAFFFEGRPAVRRVCRLHRVKVLAIDFVENRVEHHILCGIPPERFEAYETALMEVLRTYAPKGRPAPAAGAPGPG